MNGLLSSCFLVVLTPSAGLNRLDAPVDPAAPESLAHLRVKLPIQLFWNYLVIGEGSIGKVQKVHFLVDTGAYLVNALTSLSWVTPHDSGPVWVAITV